MPDHYVAGGRAPNSQADFIEPLGLTAQGRRDLIASLTGEPELRDQRWSNPWN